MNRVRPYGPRTPAHHAAGPTAGRTGRARGRRARGSNRVERGVATPMGRHRRRRRGLRGGRPDVTRTLAVLAVERPRVHARRAGSARAPRDRRPDYPGTTDSPETTRPAYGAKRRFTA